MNILVLHRVPFQVLRYDELIDHQLHDVTYLGAVDRIADIPPELRAKRVELEAGTDYVSHVAHNLTSFAGIERVVSASQYTLRAAARIRELLDCVGMRTAAFDFVDDKVAMKSRIHALGLRAPRYMAYSDFLACSEWPWSSKTVLKPRAETASRNVSVFATPEALKQHAAGSSDVMAGPGADNMQVEEFIEGPILHFDGIARGGEVLLLQPSRYFGTCLDYALGSPLGSMQFDDLKIQAEAERYVRATGIVDGAFHLEMILADDGLCFLEIAPRVGGGGINDVMRLRWGIDLVSADLAIQAGMPGPEIISPRTSESFGFYIVPGHLNQGRTCRVQTSYSHPDCIVDESLIDPSTPLGADISHNQGEVPLYLIVKHDDAVSSDELMSGLHDSIIVEYSKERHDV